MWLVIHEATAPSTQAELLEEETTTKTTLPLWKWLAAAAAVLLVVGAGWLTFGKRKGQSTIYSAQIAESVVPLTERKNDTGIPLHIALSDGSRVVLYPRSQLSYSDPFKGDKREVFLSGKGYFEVEKDDAKPFIVFANDLVTKVVGTSFTIDAFAGNKNPSVKVNSGRVKVYTLAQFQESDRGQPEETVLLTANQQTTYDLTKKNFATGTIPKPTKATTPQNRPDFNFQNVAVTDVFKTLEESYGVTIEYAPQTLKNCSITAPLDDEPLFRKLDIVCQTIGARYEVFGTRIVVTGPGCAL